MSIRLRLALWYAGFLALMFLLFAPTVYLLFERELLLEVDRRLSPAAERVVRALQENPGVLEGLARTGATSSPIPDVPPVPLLAPLTSPDLVVELLDPNGRVLGRSPEASVESVPVPDEAFATSWWGAAAGYTATGTDVRYRAVLVPVPGASEPRGFVLVARSLQSVDEALARMRVLLLVGNATGLLLAVGIGWLIAKRELRPIEEITQTARAIALSRGFSRRLKVGRPTDEVGRLAVTFNEMLASLDEAYAAQRRFVADASHELRSPLTSIRSNIDILRRMADAPRDERMEALDDVAAEVDRMIQLTSDLLLLARADAGQRIEMEKLSLDDLLKSVFRQMEPRADGVALEMGPLRPTLVRGNATWLKQLLLILLDNAVKYTPAGGSVTLSLERDGDMAVVRVQDTGIGISPEDLPHIFERFYRADKARARDEGGSGLGLAVARWIAEQHSGELLVQSEVGKGSSFSLRLPALAARAHPSDPARR